MISSIHFQEVFPTRCTRALINASLVGEKWAKDTKKKEKDGWDSTGQRLGRTTPRVHVNTACIYLFITRLASNRDKGLVAGGSRIRRRVYARMRSIPLPFDHLHIHTRIIKSPKSREIEARKACPILDHLSCCFPSPALQFTPSVPVIPSLFPSLAVQRIKPINESTPRLVFELKKIECIRSNCKNVSSSSFFKSVPPLHR